MKRLAAAAGSFGPVPPHAGPATRGQVLTSHPAPVCMAFWPSGRRYLVTRPASSGPVRKLACCSRLGLDCLKVQGLCFGCGCRTSRRLWRARLAFRLACARCPDGPALGLRQVLPGGPGRDPARCSQADAARAALPPYAARAAPPLTLAEFAIPAICYEYSSYSFTRPALSWCARHGCASRQSVWAPAAEPAPQAPGPAPAPDW